MNSISGNLGGERILFDYIFGKATNIFDDIIVVETNGIGYRIYSTINSINKIVIGDTIKIFTHLVVRDDAINLYGFICRDELWMFEQLISVSRIGPKLAISILSTYTPDSIAKYISCNDINNMIKIPGVGRKTAQRIILELRDKMKSFNLNLKYDVNNELIDGSGEIVEALISLGYNKQEAEVALQSIDIKNIGIEKSIKEALKILMK